MLILTMLIQVGSITFSAKVSSIVFISFVLFCNIRSIPLTHRSIFSMILQRVGRMDRSHRHIFEPYIYSSHIYIRAIYIFEPYISNIDQSIYSNHHICLHSMISFESAWLHYYLILPGTAYGHRPANHSEITPLSPRNHPEITVFLPVSHVKHDIT